MKDAIKKTAALALSLTLVAGSMPVTDLGARLAGISGISANAESRVYNPAEINERYNTEHNNFNYLKIDKLYRGNVIKGSESEHITLIVDNKLIVENENREFLFNVECTIKKSGYEVHTNEGYTNYIFELSTVNDDARFIYFYYDKDKRPFVEMLSPIDFINMPDIKDPNGEKTITGWYYDIDYNCDPFVFGGTTGNIVSNQIIILYAKWENINYEVRFDTGGLGTAPDTQKFNRYEDEELRRATAPAPVTDAGINWIFNGWYDIYSGRPFDFENTPISSDITIRADWIRANVVRFDANGHGSDPKPQVINPTSQDIYATAPEKDESVGIDWVLKGWYKQNSDTPFDFSTEIDADVNLVARWEEAPYKIQLDESAKFLTANGSRASENDTVVLTVMDGYNIGENTPVVKFGEETVDLTTNNDGTYSFTMPAGDVNISLPEGSVQKTEYTITKGNGIKNIKIKNGDEFVETDKATLDDEIYITLDIPDSQVLKKLSVTGDIKPERYYGMLGSVYKMNMPAKNIDISAEYVDLDKFTVIVEANEEKYAEITEQSTGITYKGYLEKDLSVNGKSYCSMIFEAPEDATDMTLRYKKSKDTADWENEINITVSNSLDDLSNGAIVKGNTNIAAVSFISNASASGGTQFLFTTAKGTVKAPQPQSKDGYAFVNWVDDNGNTYNVGSDVTARENGVIALNANWKRNRFTVTFDSGVASQTVTNGNKVTKPEDPKKEGMAFANWIVAERTNTLAKDQVFDFNTVITEDVKLKAEWKHVHNYIYLPLDDNKVLSKSIQKRIEESGYYDERYKSIAHVKYCKNDAVILENHKLDKDGKCLCGYQAEKPEKVAVYDITGNPDTLKPIEFVKGSSCTLTAEAKNSKGQIFDCWYYATKSKGQSGYTSFKAFSQKCKISFTVPKGDPMEEICLYAVYKDPPAEQQSVPDVLLIARHGTVGKNKAMQFGLAYQLPSGWKATAFEMRVGDNDRLCYFTPDTLSGDKVMASQFKSVVGQGGLGSYYCFEPASSLTALKIAFSKVPIYRPREDNIIASKNYGNNGGNNKYVSATLADKMYAGKGITVQDMALAAVGYKKPGTSGSTKLNVVPADIGYSDDHIYYAMGLLECIDDKGKKRTFIIDAIADCANDIVKGKDSQTTSLHELK